MMRPLFDRNVSRTPSATTSLPQTAIRRRKSRSFAGGTSGPSATTTVCVHLIFHIYLKNLFVVPAKAGTQARRYEAAWYAPGRLKSAGRHDSNPGDSVSTTLDPGSPLRSACPRVSKAGPGGRDDDKDRKRCVQTLAGDQEVRSTSVPASNRPALRGRPGPSPGNGRCCRPGCRRPAGSVHNRRC
jgi:hypothetical protein